MNKAQYIQSLETLIAQLSFAVERYKGKTTITENDLDVLRAALAMAKSR